MKKKENTKIKMNYNLILILKKYIGDRDGDRDGDRKSQKRD
jgi:hypothetical protein